MRRNLAHESAPTRRNTGKREPIDLSVGDRVIYSKYAGNEVKLEEEDYLILSEKDILAVVAANGKKK